MKMPQITIFLILLLGFLLPSPCYAYRDLETGVFISRDPAGMADGPNLYTYVHQNPWTKLDPEGLSAELIFKVINKGKTLFGDIIKLDKRGIPILGAGRTADSYLQKEAQHLVEEAIAGRPAIFRWKDKYDVPIKKTGFPDFSDYAKIRQEIPNMVGGPADHAVADTLAGISAGYRTKHGLTWHHNEDMKTMELIPSELNAMQHAGGASVIRKGVSSLVEILGPNTAIYMHSLEAGTALTGGLGVALAKDGVELLDPGLKLGYEQTFGRIEGLADKVREKVVDEPVRKVLDTDSQDEAEKILSEGRKNWKERYDLEHPKK